MRAKWVFCFLLGASTLLFACERSETKPAPARAMPESQAETKTAALPAIVFLGDSLTAGRGLSEDAALPALIEKRVNSEQLPFSVINAGRSGDTTAGGRSRIQWYLRDTVNARVLVIGLGSNDAMRGQSLESIGENLRQLIRVARKAKPNLAIYLWELKTFPNMGADYGETYEALFPQIAKEEKVELLPFPLAGVAAVPALNQADGIHPNAEGTRLVAENIWRSLLPRLKQLAPEGGK